MVDDIPGLLIFLALLYISIMTVSYWLLEREKEQYVSILSLCASLVALSEIIFFYNASELPLLVEFIVMLIGLSGLFSVFTAILHARFLIMLGCACTFFGIVILLTF